MIIAKIAQDQFLVWQLPPRQARQLVPGLTPWTVNGQAFLLFAAAEFRRWRLHGLPGIGRLRVAGWLVPCSLADGRIGNAFVRRFVDHALLCRSHPRIRLTPEGVVMAGVAAGRRRHGPVPASLEWFADDRCGLVRSGRTWRRWPIAKADWTWSGSAATLESSWAEAHGAQALGMITLAPTIARWSQARAL